MEAAFREHVRLMLRHWWQLGVSAVAGFVGLLMDMDAISVPLPSWVWWTVALGSFIVAQFLSFATLHKETEKYRLIPRPNMALYDIYYRLFYERTQVPTETNPYGYAIGEIQKQAIAGNFQVFGTTRNPENGLGVVVPIDPKYWENNQFEEGKGWDLSENDKKEKMHTVGSELIYYNLQVDSRQVDLCWPHRKRLKFQLPFRWETI